MFQTSLVYGYYEIENDKADGVSLGQYSRMLHVLRHSTIGGARILHVNNTYDPGLHLDHFSYPTEQPAPRYGVTRYHGLSLVVEADWDLRERPMCYSVGN